VHRNRGGSTHHCKFGRPARRRLKLRPRFSERVRSSRLRVLQSFTVSGLSPFHSQTTHSTCWDAHACRASDERQRAIAMQG